MSASDAAPLPRLGEVFFDVRGDSRSMRLSWYADTGVAVFSIWQGGMCTGTFRLPIDDLPRMIETLQRGPQQRRRSAPDGGRRERAGSKRGRNESGYYGEGDYGDGEYADGDYSHDAGHEAGAYHEGGYDDAGHEAGPYHEGGYDDAGYDLGAQTQAGIRPGGQGPEGYGPDDPASVSRRSGGGHRAPGYADSGGYPDAPGYGSATTGESTSRSDIPAGGYWQQPDPYQPGEYQSDGYPSDYQAEHYQGDGYETDGYRSDSYRTDGYQTAAYQPRPADHGADVESNVAGYGEERFVPPYVQAPGEAYPNDNLAAAGPGGMAAADRLIRPIMAEILPRPTDTLRRHGLGPVIPTVLSIGYPPIPPSGRHIPLAGKWASSPGPTGRPGLQQLTWPMTAAGFHAGISRAPAALRRFG